MSLFLTIPAYFITIFAAAFGVEYVGRFIYIKPINYEWLAKAIAHFYLATIYLIYYLGEVPPELRHVLGRYGIVAILGSDLLFAIITHVKSFRGDWMGGKETWLIKLLRRHNG